MSHESTMREDAVEETYYTSYKGKLHSSRRRNRGRGGRGSLNNATTALNPISAGGGGGVESIPSDFSLAIAPNINRSISNFLTFKFPYRDII